MISFELTCCGCGWRTISGRDDAVTRLRRAGLLRRDPDPADELVDALLLETAPRLTCPACRQQGLAVARAASGDDDGDWQAAVLCELCRQPIPLERIEAIPGVKRCAACQGRAESGRIAADDIEYCPQCGAPVKLRVSRGAGITRYKRECTGDPPCRL